MTQWQQGAAIEADAERELLEMLRAGGDSAVTVRWCDDEIMVWAGSSKGEECRIGMGSTFAAAWHGRGRWRRERAARGVAADPQA